MATTLGLTGAPTANFDDTEVPVIAYSSPTTRLVDVVLSIFPTNTGGDVTTWAIDSGALPTGLSLDAGTGEVSGTPTVIESQTVVISATNDGGVDTASLTINVVESLGGGRGGLVMTPVRSSLIPGSLIRSSLLGG